jgi:hypothetical protein
MTARERAVFMKNSGPQDKGEKSIYRLGSITKSVEKDRGNVA